MNCPLCEGPAELLYDKLQDRVFGATGLWSMARCTTHGCGMHWLHPMPTPAELTQAYSAYYTHSEEDGSSPKRGLARRAYSGIVAGYLRHRYGYFKKAQRIPFSRLWPLLYLFPLRRQREERDVMHLPFMENQSLLDIGCGSGARLLRFSELGWNAQGIDFDPDAIAVAKARGCQVQCGNLEEAQFQDRTFDVVSMNHVIEHIPDPKSTLFECYRILKPGGKLAIATPNIDSWGHKRFGPNWRGLEPPRHLHLFNASAINRVLSLAGFRDISTHSYVALSVLNGSLLIAARASSDSCDSFAKRAGVFKHARAFLLSVTEMLLLFVNSNRGECIFSVSIRP